MSEKSPLFNSAVELLAHSIELFTQGKEQKYKFIILHLANAIELICKDRLIDKGVSIYEKNSNRTLPIWTVFTELEKVGIIIPERPVIELLVDDRNTIQHRFGYPNTATVFYYLEQVVAFFKRLFSDEYGVDFVEVIKLYVTESDLVLFGLAEKPKKKEVDESLDELFELSPNSAIARAFNVIESKFGQLAPGIASDTKSYRPIWQNRSFVNLLDELINKGFLEKGAVNKFNLLRDARNRAAHHVPFEGVTEKESLKEVLELAKKFISGLDKAIESGYLMETQETESQNQ
jgi:hypothetical protein